MTSQTNTQFELQGGEQALITALGKGEPCMFVYEGPNAQPDSERTIRGAVLGKILRSEHLAGQDAAVPLPRTVGIIGAIITGELDMSGT